MEKREEILINATHVFMSSGIKSVTMEDLARKLGISKKTIYQFFKDKNELIDSILISHLEEDKEKCLMIRSQSVNAIQALYDITAKVGENLHAIHPSLIYDLEKYHPKTWLKMQEHMNGFVLETILSNIERGRKEELYRLDFDHETIGRMYVSLIDAVVKGLMQKNGNTDILSTFHEVIGFIIQGLITEKGRRYVELKENENNA